MSIKDLFDESAASKLVSKKSIHELGSDVESADYVRVFLGERESYIPQVDFSKPENFAIFGSAESYYEDAITRIHVQYPYDGSLKEKLQWQISSSFLDQHLFENDYPRTNGHALLSPTGWGTLQATLGEYGQSDVDGYIQVKGGPHKDPNNTALSKIYPSEGGTANILDASENRESNLKCDLQNDGFTVEFWLQKDGFTPADTNKEVLFDLWNGEASSSAEYGRLTIEISGTSASESPFRITAQSGTAGYFNQQIGASIQGTGSLASWNHYAFSFLSASSGVETKFYINGDLNQSTTLGTSGINEIAGPLIANIGALRASPSGTLFAGTEMEGWGKLSGSIDEFRCWKTKRNAQDIGRYWFTQVGGGTNTDTANTNLGVYYKFNEGITGKTGIDSVVLDYSGRISNGTWVGYESASRSTESAMVLAGSAETEFKDPILYSTHPDVVSLLLKKRKEGKNYDDTNNSSIYSSYPGWIIEEDSERREGGDLRKLTQIMASYLDTLHLQVESLATLKDVEYISGSINDAHRPTPLAQRLLTSRGFIAPEIFTQANVLEFFLNRDEKREYDLTLSDVKNFIYQNINNNLVGIYKKKGTEQAFRNLIRCFGIDDELIKVNLYANNYTYTLEDNYKEKTTRKTFVDFADTDRYSATVHQFRNTLNSNTVSFISGSEGSPTDLEAGVGLTVETEIFFPRKRDISESQYMETPFTQASLFGMHTADSALSDNDLTWAVADVANFQISTERSDIFSRHAKFRLTGSAGGFLPELTSSLIQNVYNNERWLVALRLKRGKYPFVGGVDGTEDDTYTINFYGINTKFKETINEFELTGSVTLSQGLDILKNPKRIFAGAHRQNFTGSVLGRSDVKVGAVRVWYDYLSNDTLKAHAVDPLNYGAEGVYKKAYLFEDHLTTTDIKKIETLALNWDFQTVTGSSASGQFNVIDFSSGSLANSNRHGWISNIVNLQHSGRGFGFVASDTNSVDNRYVYTYKPQLPEVLTNNDTVQILERDDEVFTRDTRPVDFYYAVEKSLYQDISKEMLDMFSTVKDFNNLIGEPVNRYRRDYKDLGKLRQLFFERVRNNPDFEKFTDFYKWFDNALNQMIVQLIPASAKISEKLRNVVESHILERNKYQTKYPFFKSALPGELEAFNPGHDVMPTRTDPVGTEDIDPDWWHCVVDRREPGIATGNSIIDAQREVYRLQQTACPRRLITLDAIPGDEKQTNTQDRLTPEENTISIREPEYVNEITIAPLKINPPALTNIKKGLTQKVKLPLNIVGTEIQSGRLPLDAYSSSYANPYSAIVGNYDLFVDHQDDGGTLYTTLQGPFTEKFVGGRQYRHVDLATPVLTNIPAGFATADYSQPMSVGDRTATITVTYSPPLADPNQLLTGTVTALVDAQGAGVAYFFNSAAPPGTTPLAGSYIRFDFGAGNEQHITELRWTQTDTHAQGNWKVQGSNDAVAWTDVSTVQVLAGGADDSVYGAGFYSTPFSLDLIGATAAYRYYQLLYDSGNVVDDFPPGSNINPIDFKIGTPTAATTAYLLPTQADRPEGFRVNITPAQEKVSLYSAYKDSSGNTNFNLPRAVYFRDEVAKRPLNIRNIHHTTGSTKLGNYDELYQVIQTSNRRTNNRWWVKYNNSEETTPEVILDDSNSFLLGSGFASPHVSGVLEYIKPVRGKSPHVFVERFGAPGGPNSSGDVDGGPGLDALSAEYSIYSTVNYRNNFVRRFGIDEWSKIHSAQFGIDPNNPTRASFHKTNRNPIKKMEESGSSTITASMYDNYFVQHPIPQSDLQYAWITASAISSPFGYSIDARRFPSGSEVITFLDASEINAGNIFVDFVGLNTLIYDPVVEVANIVSASSGEYRNTLFGTLNLVESLNGLSLHRNGPYGYPSWKQTRTGEHSVARVLRTKNRLQYIARAPAVEIKSANGSSYVKPARFTRRRTYVEPVATSVFKPIVHGLAIKCDDGDELFTLKHSYGNNISHFSNLILDDNFQNGYGAIIASSPTPNQIYDDLLEFYVGGSLENSPVESLIYLNYAESIYPRAINRFLDRTRSRTEYDVKTEMKWRSLRAARDNYGVENSQGSVSPPNNESCWPLDARTLFSAGPSLELVLDGATPTNQNDGAGELLNPYSVWHCGNKYSINPAALYARREPEYVTSSVPPHLITAYGAGDTLWETATQSGYEPFDDTYDDYSEFIRLKGQDFSIVPEFRISDHIDYYVEQNNGDFFGTDLPDDWLRVDGAEVSSSAVPTSMLPESIAGGNNKFYSLYTHSDFLRYFKQIDDEHKKYKGELDHQLTLQCKSIIKFRPRDGFYPAQRTLQLATLFSQSCFPAISLGGSDASWRTALTPFYAPGIMYNTIKSGIAVDYPLIQNISPFNYITASSTTLTDGDEFGFFPEMYQPSARTYSSWQALWGETSIEPYYFISSSFPRRLPFESILDPTGLSNANGVEWVDNEPHISASLASSATIKGDSRATYKLAVDNFLAETINFYLQDGKMTSFVSREFDGSGVSLDTSKEYIMNIKLSRDSKDLKNMSLSAFAQDTPSLVSATSSFFEKNIEIYERETAFGPPVLEFSSGSTVPGKLSRLNTFSCAPFTPPYFDGAATVTISYKPTVTQTPLSEILRGATYTYHRRGVLTGSFAYGSAMQISASIKFDTVLNTRSVTRDQKGNIISVTDQPGNRGEQWVIEPRFETPILDFSGVSITEPLSGAGSISKGIWHQYGTLPQGSVTNATAKGGLFLNLEYPSVDVVDTATTASLLTALGFDQTNGGVLSKRLGNTSTSTVVSEAVVAIPFYSKTESVNNFDELHFLPLVSEGAKIQGLSPSRSAVYEAMLMIALDAVPNEAERFGLEDYTPQTATPAIVDMVRKMNKYILPPKFDFLRFFAEREPFAMYIFDFEQEFNRLDLTNMWQNVSPPSGKDFKIMTSTVSHMIDPAELGGDFTDKQLRWLVFKVKQKAEKFYLNKTLSAFDDPKVVKAFSAQNKADLEKRVPYSYNWPYDYFSLIELIKIDADINIEAPHEKGRGKTKALNIKTSDNNKLAQASTTSTKKLTLLE